MYSRAFVDMTWLTSSVPIAFIWMALWGGTICEAQFNPSILQDTRLEPNSDGTFGFLYRTEDGIQASAKGDSSGVIQGSYSYTDPTGLKVNINYNAGSRNPQPDPAAQGNMPVYNRPAPAQAQAPSYNAPRSLYYRPQPSQAPEPAPQQYASESQHDYSPRYRPPPSYRQPPPAPFTPAEGYSRPNEIYDNDYRSHG